MANEDVIRILREYKSGGGDGQTHFGPHSFDLTDETVEHIISALERDRWISVEEKLPIVNERVLACVNILGKPSAWDAVRWNGEEWEAEAEAMYDYWTTIDYPVTHWMPLPEPPKEET